MLKRLFGAGLGWTMGGPIGALVGWWLGSKFENSPGAQLSSQPTTASDFLLSLIILCSKVMKADGQVLRSEVEYVKTFLVKNFGAQSAQELMQALKEFQKRDFSLSEVTHQINRHMRPEEKMQLLYLLFGVAQADGSISPSELTVIEEIANSLRLRRAFASIKAMYYGEAELESAYAILGLSQTASKDEVKKAYRKLSLKNHPDRVSHLGEEVRQSAEQKFKSVNAAYQTIKKQRNFS